MLAQPLGARRSFPSRSPKSLKRFASTQCNAPCAGCSCGRGRPEAQACLSQRADARRWPRL